MSEPTTQTPGTSADSQRPAGWLNRNVIGMGLTSLLADLCYETATAVLPGLWRALSAPAYALGLMEGLSDGLASFTKLAAGWYSDRLSRRKPLVVAGYLVTAGAIGAMGLILLWPVLLLLRVVAWIGKGIRGPARNALLAESVPSEHRGKAFGLHRAGDTVGAILGPLLAAWLAGVAGTADAQDLRAVQTVLLWTLVPGLGSVLAILLLVRETQTGARATRKFWAAVRDLPAPYGGFLLAVGMFGAGDFSHTLLILAAIDQFTPDWGLVAAAQWGAILYAVRNVAAALAAFPAGWLSDHWGRRGLLAAAYALGCVNTVGFAYVMAVGETSTAWWVSLFVAAGVVNAVQEALESAATADYVSDKTLHGVAYGVLGAVNGAGDFLSSLAVGLLWMWSPVCGFAFAAVMMLLGAGQILRAR